VRALRVATTEVQEILTSGSTPTGVGPYRRLVLAGGLDPVAGHDLHTGSLNNSAAGAVSKSSRSSEPSNQQPDLAVHVQLTGPAPQPTLAV